MKITVYIVDDESMAIRYLEALLAGISYEVEVVGRAQNGVKAVSEIVELNPDFVFTDISMPVMNGLQLSEEVLKQNPSQKIFMLTAYRDFEYAQRGISVGVAHYFVKNELSEEQLETVITKNMTDIEKEKREHHHILETNIRAFFRNDKITDAYGWAYKNKPLQRYIVCYITKRPKIVIRHGEHVDDIYIDCYEIEQKIHHRMVYLRAFVELSRGEYCGIFFLQNEGLNIQSICKEIANEIITQYMDGDYICLISDPIINFETLPCVYYKLREHSRFLYVSTQRLYTKEDMMFSNSSLDEAVNLMIGKWKQSIADLRLQEAMDKLPKIIDGMSGIYDVYKFSEEIKELNYALLAQIKQQKFQTSSFRMQNFYTNIEAVKSDFHKIIKSFDEHIQLRKEKQYSYQVILAQEYIHQNYMHNISVADIAAASHVSEGHLRRCFKKEMDENVVTHLTNFRLECAKNLIKENMKNLDEIWKQTGFASPQYFSYVFKKKEGISPREYQRKSGLC